MTRATALTRPRATWTRRRTCLRRSAIWGIFTKIDSNRVSEPGVNVNYKSNRRNSSWTWNWARCGSTRRNIHFCVKLANLTCSSTKYEIFSSLQLHGHSRIRRWRVSWLFRMLGKAFFCMLIILLQLLHFLTCSAISTATWNLPWLGDKDTMSVLSFFF